MAFYKNGSPVSHRNKHILVKFLENGIDVVIYVYDDYKLACEHISNDKDCWYYGKITSTIKYIRENKLRWLKSLNIMYNKKCTEITVL